MEAFTKCAHCGEPLYAHIRIRGASERACPQTFFRPSADSILEGGSA